MRDWKFRIHFDHEKAQNFKFRIMKEFKVLGCMKLHDLS